jgi:hypothetical protein
VVFDAGPLPAVTEIRAYDLPDAIAAGAYRVAFDLSTIPSDSPCAGLAIKVMAAHDGILYASGCHPGGPSGCTPEQRICVFDTRSGTALPAVHLEDFADTIRGLGTLDGGRLVVLASQSPRCRRSDTSIPARPRHS